MQLLAAMRAISYGRALISVATGQGCLGASFPALEALPSASHQSYRELAPPAQVLGLAASRTLSQSAHFSYNPAPQL